MNNEKLNEIGNKLDISEMDINNIKKESQKRRIQLGINQLIIIFVSIVGGFLFGKFVYSRNTYPYITQSFFALAGISITNPKSKRMKSITTLITIIISIIGFIIACGIGQFTEEVYSQGIEYSVYNRIK